MLFDRTLLQKTLADFDQREIEIEQTLTNYAQIATTRQKQRNYAQLQRIYAKERAHNVKCRLMLEAMLAELPVELPS